MERGLGGWAGTTVGRDGEATLQFDVREQAMTATRGDGGTSRLMIAADETPGIVGAAAVTYAYDADVPSGDPLACWIEAATLVGVLAFADPAHVATSDGDSTATRAELAVALVRVKHGASFTTPTCVSAPVPDVPDTHRAATTSHRRTPTANLE
jgi:hypothetical protein